MRSFWKLLRDRKAATAIEYAMIVAFVAIAAMGAILLATTATVKKWNAISDNVSSSM
jgi:Flp pilus assembly pilin Flp